MRITCFLLSGILIINCNRHGEIQETGSECRLTKVVVTGQDQYNYDAEGRIISILKPDGDLTGFLYTRDKVIKSAQDLNITYYLNADGLADSSHSVFFGSQLQEDTLATRQFYTYQNGYLIRKTDLSRYSIPLSNETIDTIHTDFNYLNGNLVRITSNTSHDLVFEYHNKPANANHFLDPRKNTWSFLGKTSVDVADKQKDQDGNLMLVFTYLFDENGNVTKRRTYDSNSSLIESADFTYQCP